MEIGATRIGSVLEVWLIVTSLTCPDARAKMQNLGDAVNIAIDRSNKGSGGEGQVLIPGEAGEERSVRGRREALAEDAGGQTKVLRVIHH